MSDLKAAGMICQIIKPTNYGRWAVFEILSSGKL